LNKHCMDPCCGTGSIPQNIINQKKARLDISTAVNTTWASDKYEYPLQVANISLTSLETINEPIQIFKHNVLNIISGENIEIVNPINGELINVEIPKLGAVISNLPFIPFESIQDDDLQLVNKILSDVITNTGISLSSRSDLYCFIIFSLHKLLESSGRIGVITSNSWLGTAWGKDFFNALNRYFTVNQIHISGQGRWFLNAQVVTVILILTKKDTVSVPQEDTCTSFCKWNKSLSEINNNQDITETLVNSSLLDKELDVSIMSINKYSYRQISELINLSVSLNALFHGINWVTSIKNKLIPISEVFRVLRGERRGWDPLFYPSQNHGIEASFIKPVLLNTRGISRLFTKAENDAFCCSYTMDELLQQDLTGALNWIHRFETTVNEKGKPLPQVLRRTNMHWYEMRDTSTADICTTMNPDQRLFYSRFEEPTFINQRLIGLKRKEDYPDIQLNHALLNSIIGMFFIEAIGFGRGLGALDINKDSINRAFMLDPNQVTDENRKLILEKFSIMCTRDIQNTIDELKQKDRLEFDLAVLRSFGIDNLYDDIKKSLMSLQQARLSVR
jgi:hypothetical protein